MTRTTRARRTARHWLTLCVGAAMALCVGPAQAGFGGTASGSYAAAVAAGYGHHRERQFRHGYGGRHHHHHQRDHGRHSRDYRHHRHHRGHSGRGELLLGGIVLGGLLSHGYHSARDYPPPRAVRYQRIVVEPTIRRTRVETPVARRLYRDLDGNCFERQQDGRGRELLIELPARECDW